jgi:hypothetical protein
MEKIMWLCPKKLVGTCRDYCQQHGVPHEKNSSCGTGHASYCPECMTVMVRDMDPIKHPILADKIEKPKMMICSKVKECKSEIKHSHCFKHAYSHQCDVTCIGVGYVGGKCIPVPESPKPDNRIHIVTEKVMKDGILARKIISVKALTLTELPPKYFDGSPSCYLSSSGLVIFVVHEIPKTLVIGANYEETLFQELLAIIKQCGNRLHTINSKSESKWEGKEEFTI